MSLQERVYEVARLRRLLSEAESAMQEEKRAFDSKNAELSTTLKELSTGLETCEAALRRDALACVQQTGDRCPAHGVGVRMLTVYDYDPFRAFDFARRCKDADQLLKLSNRAFGQLIRARAEEGKPLEFVKIAVEPQIVLSRQLPEGRR